MIISVVGMMLMAIVMAYALWKFVFYDAQARGMDASTWSWFSLLSKNSSGFIVYLYNRKNYIVHATELQEILCLKYKRILIISSVLMFLCSFGVLVRIAEV